MKLFNSLGREVQELTPLEAGKISLYTCGPTVYDYMHIGNLRTFIVDDTLRRALSAEGYVVRHSMNVTDVGHLVSDGDEGEDKLEKGAVRSGKTVWEVAEHYLEAFLRDQQLVGDLEPTVLTRATDAIASQIAMVQTLLKKGYAYQTEEAIYFDVRQFAEYGHLSGQKLEDKHVGARSDVVVSTLKKHPQDFALWFFTVGRFADHAMHWESPWGEGFPGWHVECSAIIEETLGTTIDIHTGGIDNMTPHHENEIAQSQATHDGAPLARTWLHVRHLMVDGAKMSKSKQNFYTLQDLAERGIDPLAFRLLILQAHYRSEQNFTWQSLEAASARLLDLRNWALLEHDRRSGDSIAPEILEAGLTEIKQQLANDLNTPQALASLGALMHQVTSVNDQLRPAFRHLLQQLDELFGLRLSGQVDITPEQYELLVERQSAKNEGNFALADNLRAQLQASGIEPIDTPTGALWRRTSL